jgi:hypothetical protein
VQTKADINNINLFKKADDGFGASIIDIGESECLEFKEIKFD